MERKAFLANQKHQHRVSQRDEQDYSANNERNGDYYEYPSLSQFTNELSFLRKMMERIAFLANQKHQYRVS